MTEEYRDGERLPLVVPFKQSLRSSSNCRSCKECVYCGRPIVSRHEHDHMPAAARFGGDEIVAACLDCHDLKDRLRFEKWPDEAICAVTVELMNGTNRGAMRIFLAKTTNLLFDYGDDAMKWKALALAYKAALVDAGIDLPDVDVTPEALRRAA